MTVADRSYDQEIEAEMAARQPRFTVSVAAELAGMHPQTLRQYDRLGLVVPARTRGGGRRYSRRDVEQLVEVQRLSQEEGVNLAGISRIMDLERQVDRLKADIARLQVAARDASRVFAADSAGQVTRLERGQRAAAGRTSHTTVVHRSTSTALVIWGN